MGRSLLKWAAVGVLAGVWVAVYELAGHHDGQAIWIVFTILGAAHACKCAQKAGEGNHA